MATEEEMRKEAKVKFELLLLSCLEVGHWAKVALRIAKGLWCSVLAKIRHLVDSLSGSDKQTLSKFRLIEYHFVFDSFS